MVLAMLLAAVSVQAQTVRTYQADIPFDFTIGDDTYAAGEFVISLERPNYLADILTIRNPEGDRLQRAAVMKNGNRSETDKTTLVFDRYDDEYVLIQIVSPEFGFSAPKSETATWMTITKNLQQEPETVAIVLTSRILKFE